MYDSSIKASWQEHRLVAGNGFTKLQRRHVILRFARGVSRPGRSTRFDGWRPGPLRCRRESIRKTEPGRANEDRFAGFRLRPRRDGGRCGRAKRCGPGGVKSPRQPSISRIRVGHAWGIRPRSFTTITAKTSRSNSPRMPNANATYGRVPRRFHAAWSASFCATAPAAVPSRAEPKSCKTILIGATWFCFTNTFTATAERAWAPAIKPGGPAWSRNSSSKAENNVPPLEFREAIPGDETVLLPRRLYRRVVHRSQPGKWVSMPFISKSTAATIRRWNFIAAPAIKITTAY